MPAMLLRPWIQRALIAGSLTAIAPAVVLAGWPWAKPAPAVVTPVGPPIYAPSAAPTVVNYQPAYGVPANVPPTLVGPPTTYTPAPAVGVAPYVAPAPAVVAPNCGTCGVAPRVTGYVPPTYSTNWAQVPTTTYRPVVSVDPATGLPINAVQPCTTNIWQARRVPNTWWGGMWPTTNPPPTVVAYTPANVTNYTPAQIAAYPQARIPIATVQTPTVIAPRPLVTQYAPAPVVTQYAPAPVVTQYAAPRPVVTQYAPAPTVTQYAPAPAPAVTQYAPAPTVTQYAPAPAPTYVAPPPLSYAPPTPAPAPTTQPCPHGCPNGHCQQAPPATNGAPSTFYPQAGDPANIAPNLNAPQGSYQGGVIVPNNGNGREPAAIAPRLENRSLDGTTRSYAPTEYDNEPTVPVGPPVERRVIETPRNEAPQLQSPQLQSPQLQSPGTNSSSIRQPSQPLIPFSRPTQQPASTVMPERNLRLVPDPDAEKLELRRDAIPNLIKPGDRSTQVAPMRHVVAAADKPTTAAKPVVVPAAISAAKLDDSGWRSVGK